MTILKTPYPKSSVLKFSKFLAGISISVTFILVVFQPFGTATFTHSLKYLILSGYGLVIFLSGSLFFIIFDLLLTNAIKDRWTIGYEIGLLFCTIIISQTSCFLYYVWLFGTGISIKAFINFLIIASSVSILPVGFYLLYIYQKYRDVQHAKSEKYRMNNNAENENSLIANENITKDETDQTIKIIGTGKSEKYMFYQNSLIYIIADDNYVIIHTIENQKIKKWMIRATMNEVENQLNHSFIRIHRSYIINKNYIEVVSGNITNTRVKLRLVHEEFPVSRTKVVEIRQK